MQGSTRPPDSTPRVPRRSELLFQMSRNGLLVRADNSDLSYKAILTRLVPGAPTYGAALEVLSRAPLAESRRALLGAALLRALQEVVVARMACQTVPRVARPEEGGAGDASVRRNRCLGRAGACQGAVFLRRALDGAVRAASFAGPLLGEYESAHAGTAFGSTLGVAPESPPWTPSRRPRSPKEAR